MSVSVFKFTTEITDGSDGTIIPSQVSAIFGVNRLVEIAVVGTDKADAQAQRTISVATFISNYSAWAFEQQTRLLTTARAETDSIVTVTSTPTGGAGEESILDIETLVARAGYNVNMGSVSKTLAYSDQLALLAGWNGTIYASASLSLSPTVASSGTGNLVTAIRALQGLSVAAVMLLLLDLYQTQWNFIYTQYQQANDIPSQDTFAAINKANQIYLPLFKAFLQDNISGTTLNGGLVGWTDTGVLDFAKTCHRILTSNGNALEAMMGASGLPYEFGIQYVSTPVKTAGGFYGKLILLSKAYAATGAGTITIDPVQISNIDVGGSGIIPVRAVILNIPLPITTSVAVQGGKAVQVHSRLIYPALAETDLSPTIAPVAAPSWMSPLSQFATTANPQTPYAYRTPTTAATAESISQSLAAQVAQAAGLNATVSDWLRMHYILLALGQSRGSIVLPLDFSYEPGFVYNVEDTLGNALFKGYLDSVGHAIQIQTGSGATGSASTTLNFTHVCMPGFVLPLS